MAEQLIGARIKALREKRGLSQDSLAQLFGFKDRQTVSAIETGLRRVTAEELVLAVEKLGAPLEYFTDPFLLVGEGRFSWRQTGVDAGRLGVRTPRRTLDRLVPVPGASGRAPDPAHAPGPRSHPSFPFRGCHAGRRSVRRRVRSRGRAGDAPRRGNGAGSRHHGAHGRRMRRHLGSGLPPARAGRGADRAPRSSRPQAFRSRPRAVPHPHLGCDAARALRRSPRDRRQSGRAAGQQLRRGSSDAARRPGAVRGLAGAVRSGTDRPVERGWRTRWA